jgi:thioester reductase-like protein
MLFRESIFVTGFPGFIASRLVERLAQSETQFFLLVQPQFVQKAMDEIEAIAVATTTPLDNFVIVEGDISKPNLGIADEDLKTLLFEVTDVYHLAAIYDLAIAKDPAFAVNFEGTKNVNDLVRAIRNLRRYNYVSTCYVAGLRQGEILESELKHDAGFRNNYEETKYLAEMEVETLRPAFPVTIYRPSVVVGDSETGETAKYDGIYYLINYIRKAPFLLRVMNVGNQEVRLNLVPVDFVVEAIATLAHDPVAVGKTIALADPNPLTTAELFDTIAKAITGRRSEFTPSPKLTEWFLNTRISPAITGLPHYGVPYFYVPQTYDTSVADSLLGPHGVKCPRFPDYVDNLLEFVREFPRL